MDTAFQIDAFQNDTFQIEIPSEGGAAVFYPRPLPVMVEPEINPLQDDEEFLIL